MLGIKIRKVLLGYFICSGLTFGGNNSSNACSLGYRIYETSDLNLHGLILNYPQ